MPKDLLYRWKRIPRKLKKAIKEVTVVEFKPQDKRYNIFLRGEYKCKKRTKYSIRIIHLLNVQNKYFIKAFVGQTVRAHFGNMMLEYWKSTKNNQ